MLTVSREKAQFPIFTFVFAVMVVLIMVILRLRMNSLSLSGPVLFLDSANDVLEEDSPFGDLFSMIADEDSLLAKEKSDEQNKKKLAMEKRKRKAGNEHYAEVLKDIQTSKVRREKSEIKYHLSNKGIQIAQQLKRQNLNIPESDLQNVKYVSTNSEFTDIFFCHWLDQRVTLKKLRLKTPPREVENFLVEIELMTRMHHPNLVKIVGCGVGFAPYYLVTEHFTQSLFNTLHDPRSSQLGWPVVRQFALDVAKGLLFLHTMHDPVAYCSLRSSSVVVGAHSVLKLADFAQARRADTGTGTDADTDHALEFYQWTAPEVLSHNSPVNTLAADVYSFGVVLWELMTRQVPYQGISVLSAIGQITQHGLHPEVPSPLPTNVLPEYIELMEKCWNQDPSKRPTMGEAESALSSMPAQ